MNEDNNLIITLMYDININKFNYYKYSISFIKNYNVNLINKKLLDFIHNLYDKYTIHYNDLRIKI